VAIEHVPMGANAADRALKIGDKKYGIKAWDNGKPDGENCEDHLAALERHLDRLRRGEQIDESGEPALAHIVARGLLALEFYERARINDMCDAPGPTKQDKHGGPFILSCGLMAGHNGKHFDRGWHEGWD
jgi:hypothetical protein